MSSQPISGANYLRVSGTAAGTTVVSSSAVSNFLRVLPNQNQTGTVTFYDSATAAGTSAAGFIAIMNNNVGSLPTSVPIGIRTKNGLVAVVGGTTDVTVVWE